MKKILTASLVAMMAVTAARAEIASTDYVTTKVNAVNTALSTYKTDNDAAVALKADKTALEAEATTRSEADTELSNRIGAFEGTGAGSVTAQVKAVSDALDAYQTANDAAVALKAAQADLTAEVNRAKAAEQANADAIAALDADYVSEDEMAAFESANTAAIAAAKSGAEATAAAALSTAQSALEGQISAEATTRSEADTELSNRIAAFEGDGAGSVTAQVKAVSDALDAYQTANDAAVALKAAQADLTAEVNRAKAAEQANTDAIAALKNTEVKANADAIAAEVSRAEAEEADIRADFAAADSALDGKISAEATARSDADTAINTKIGEVPTGKTVVGMIGEAQTAATYDDTEVRDLISDNADAITAEVSRAEAEEADIRADFAAADTQIRTDFAAADALKQGVSSELSLGSTAGAWQTLASINGYSTNCGTGKTCALSNVDGNISWVAVVDE